MVYATAGCEASVRRWLRCRLLGSWELKGHVEMNAQRLQQSRTPAKAKKAVTSPDHKDSIENVQHIYSDVYKHRDID